MILTMHNLFVIVMVCVSLPLGGSFMSSNQRIKKPIKSFLPEGFTRLVNSVGEEQSQTLDVPKQICSVEELKKMIATGYRVQDLDVRGDIASLLTPENDVHPVVKELYKRKAAASTPGHRTDGKKIAVSVEGGGMRGCVAAGMMTVGFL